MKRGCLFCAARCDWISSSHQSRARLSESASSSAHFSHFSATCHSEELTPAGVRAVRGGTAIREKYGPPAGAAAPLAPASYCCFHLLALSRWSSGEPGGLQCYQTGAARGRGNKPIIFTQGVCTHTHRHTCVCVCFCAGAWV